MPVIALLLLAAEPVPVPKGVNDSVLGTAEEFKVTGPARVCFMYSGFDLETGETSYLSYSGIHSAQLTIVGPRGSFELTESEIFARPKRPGRTMTGLKTKVVRHRAKGRLRYDVYSSSDGGGASRPLLRLEGGALTGKAADRDILDRIALNPQTGSCREAFAYGWFFE
ncbi:MAG TPA: hypothetical protein VFZ91_10660 [Allosphingosinicella sp.]